jgi:hypothetical protein
MNRYLVATVATVALSACVASTWKENDFYVGGRKTSLSPAQMSELRDAWSRPAPFSQFKTSLTASEAQWAADVIALGEAGRDRANPCRRLVLESIAPSPADIVDLGGVHASASVLDEKWIVNACGVKRAYRAFHPQYSTALAIEEARL